MWLCYFRNAKWMHVDMSQMTLALHTFADVRVPS